MDLFNVLLINILATEAQPYTEPRHCIKGQCKAQQCASAGENEIIRCWNEILARKGCIETSQTALVKATAL